MLSAGNQMLGETEQMCSVVTPQLQELQVKVKKNQNKSLHFRYEGDIRNLSAAQNIKGRGLDFSTPILLLQFSNFWRRNAADTHSFFAGRI